MAGLQVPLSTLRLAPRDALRMTRGQSGLLFLHCWRLSLFTLCRSPGAQAYFIFRFVGVLPNSRYRIMNLLRPHVLLFLEADCPLRPKMLAKDRLTWHRFL